MLPEAVRALNLLVERGKKVYVHCTAGINRASLTVVGYLTFVQVRPFTWKRSHSRPQLLEIFFLGEGCD